MRYGKNEKREAWIIRCSYPGSLIITAVLWKDNKVVIVISTFSGKQPIQQAELYCHREKRRVNIKEPNIINQYNMSMKGVDRMDQNISAYMIN